MSKNSVVLVLALVAAAGTAQAQDCTCAPGSTRTADNTQLSALLTGRMACGMVGNEKWQEHHAAGGVLWDYKRGPGPGPDPSVVVGDYGIANNVVTYRYGAGGSGGSYSYAVCAVSASSYTFCGARAIPGVTIEGTSNGPIQACLGSNNVTLQQASSSSNINTRIKR